MINVILAGALGRLGRMVAAELEGDPGTRISGAVESPGHPGIGSVFHGVPVVSSLGGIVAEGDVVVDFSSPAATMDFLTVCAGARKPFVSGTTGLSAGQMKTAAELSSETAVLISPNMSLGVNLLFRISEEAAKALCDFDIEIVETHHNKKKDSPSGTAARIAEIVRKVRSGCECVYGREGMIGERKSTEIGMHSVRGGDVVGEHTVIFAGEGERFELSHKAHSRKTFARGALRAVHFMHGKPPGLYTMADVLGL